MIRKSLNLIWKANLRYTERNYQQLKRGKFNKKIFNINLTFKISSNIIKANKMLT